MLSRFSLVQLLATPCTVAHLASLSMGFSMQEYWMGYYKGQEGVMWAIVNTEANSSVNIGHFSGNII